MKTSADSLRRATVLYLVSVGLILVGTALLKGADLMRGAPYLRVADPVFSFIFSTTQIPEWSVVAASVVAEILVLGVIASRTSIDRKLMALILLCFYFLAYRGGFWLSGSKGICPCLGSVGDWTGLSVDQVGALRDFLFAYLFAGSLILLILWKRGGQGGPTTLYWRSNALSVPVSEG